jgi:MFS family permease
VASLFHGTGPFAQANVRWYAWFTTAFNARFYYPILAILFLDLGLSLSQFVMLNAIWAATILLAEVPSGALADLIGRRKLLIAAAGLMVLEMLVLLLAPKDAGMWLFGFCAVNRVLSGLAEAAASGADEALAYDSLDDPGEWDEVLEVVMRLRSAAMVVAMVVGALVYDAGAVGLNVELAHRLPIALCLAQAVGAFLISLKFREVTDGTEKKAGFTEVFAQTWMAAKWVFTTKAAILIVIGGLLIDGVARNFATINSEYYRLIEIPTFTFGFIAAGTAFLGMYTPRLSKHLARRFSPLSNFGFTAGWAFLCLYLLGRTWDYWGVIPGIGLMAGLSHLGFLMSRYLHELASSDQRATVLSVKGLLFNMGYGAASLVFAGAVSFQKGDLGMNDEEALTRTLEWQPWIFGAAFLVFLGVAKWFGMPRKIGKR